MRTARNLILSIAFLWGILGTAAASHAQFLGSGFGAFGGGFGQGAFGIGTNLYGSGYLPVPPYYSINPPVYYNGRVFRTYGDSPYAYFPERFRSTGSYVPQFRDQEPQAQLIVNPFVPQQAPSVLPAPSSAPQDHPQTGIQGEKSYSDKSASPLPVPTVNDQTNYSATMQGLWTIAPPIKIVQNPFVTRPYNREEQIAASPVVPGPRDR